MKKTENFVMVLASGGLDSTACINFYKRINFEVLIVFFDYGQPAKNKEYKAVSKVAAYYNCDLKKIVIKNTKTIEAGLILGRNAFFYFLGLMNFPRENGLIASGIHGGTGYYDCSKDFIVQLQIMIDRYSQGTIIVAAPFLSLTKRDILEYCNIETIPKNLTYSCELGKKQPCGICATCKDIEAIYDSKKPKN